MQLGSFALQFESVGNLNFVIAAYQKNMASNVDPNIFGKWQMTESENFDAFMSALGVSYVVR